MTLSVLTPVRDAGPFFREHVRACVRAVSGLDVEIIVLDNRSIDGSCHGLPPGVLIVRTERLEPARRLFRLGRALAKGEGLLWLPILLSLPPDRFRGVVTAAFDSLPNKEPPDSVRRALRRRLIATSMSDSFVTARTRSRLDQYARTPLLGSVLSAVADWQVGVVVLASMDRNESRRPLGGAAVDGNNRARDNGLYESGHRPKPPQNSRAVRRGAKLLSVIITAHDEGAEVLRTVQSVRATTRCDHEIIVVDDGSTDGSCSGLHGLGARVIHHPARVGVAHSRDAGTRAAVGDVFAYLDAHQRADPGCLDRCAEIAALYGAIVCAPCRPLYRRYPVSYGASFGLCPERGFFSARTRIDRPSKEITRISALYSPGYLIPRSVYHRVAWITGLRGWGATDYCVALKAFFSDVDILLVNAGGTQHLFRKRIPYQTTWEGVWRNHALIARICFDDRTWTQYWLPKVFRGNVTDNVMDEMNSAVVLAEREAFMNEKVRPDREFWRGLLRIPEPQARI